MKLIIKYVEKLVNYIKNMLPNNKCTKQINLKKNIEYYL